MSRFYAQVMDDAGVWYEISLRRHHRRSLRSLIAHLEDKFHNHFVRARIIDSRHGFVVAAWRELEIVRMNTCVSPDKLRNKRDLGDLLLFGEHSIEQL